MLRCHAERAATCESRPRPRPDFRTVASSFFAQLRAGNDHQASRACMSSPCGEPASPQTPTHYICGNGLYTAAHACSPVFLYVFRAQAGRPSMVHSHNRTVKCDDSEFHKAQGAFGNRQSGCVMEFEFESAHCVRAGGGVCMAHHPARWSGGT